MRLETAVKYVAREDETNNWRLDFESEPSEHFDKVVIATGPHREPIMPAIEGDHLFAGKIIHARAFKG
jgi:dimethylaniline monooxygenase (N-oxide forming)